LRARIEHTTLLGLQLPRC